MTFSPARHVGSIFCKNRPIQLTIFLTRRCNAKCPFCFYISIDKNEAEQPELTLAEIEKIAANTGTLLWLAFSGGEIFLRQDLVDIARTFYKHNRPAIILLPTNGLLPDTIRAKTEEIIKACPKSTIAVKLSLDGDELLHDSIRGVQGGFQKVLQTYEKLGPFIEQYPNFELGINSVFCSKNQDQMDQLLDFVSGLDRIKTHTVSLIRGEVAEAGLKEVDLEKYRKTIEKMEANLKQKQAAIYRFMGGRLKAAQDILQRRLIYETARDQKSLTPCYAGRLNLVITETGELYPCEDFSPGMKIGNLRENGYDPVGLLKTAAGRRILAAIKNRKCFCTHECYFMTNILFNPARYPALLKEYLLLRPAG